MERAPKPELGWREIQTDDPDTVPTGPWLLAYERFTTPPGAVELARTDDAVQAFRFGPHLGGAVPPGEHRGDRRPLGGLDTEKLAGWA